MKLYRVDYSSTARRQLRRLDPQHRRRIMDAADRLALDPFPPGSKRLVAQDSLYRIRVGDYRVIYDVLHAEVRVIILKVGHRKDIYRER